MKKLVSMIMAMLMVLSMAACEPAAQTKDPKTLYKEANEKMEQLEEVDMTMVMDMEMTVLGQTMQIKTTSDIQVSKDALAMLMTTEVAGQSTAINMWYTDGYLYMDAMGEKIKAAATKEEAMENMTGVAAAEIQEDAFKEITAEEQGDETKIQFVADGAKMTDYVSGLLSGSQDLSELDSFTIADVEGSVTLNKDSYITGLTMTIPLTMTVSGQSFDANIEASITYNNIGQAVNIAFPDFSGFKSAEE